MSQHPIIDSHIHLYPQSHLKELTWGRNLPSDHVLNDQYSIAEYRKAIESASGSLKGFVFIEVDRISQTIPANGLQSGEPEEWNNALEEVSFFARIANGQPIPGEGHEAPDSKLLLGVVPWAPITAGADFVSKFHYLAIQRFQSLSAKPSLIKGYRLLFQDKPPGTMLQPPILSSLQWLGTQNLAFDLGIDARSGGLYQLREACELLSNLAASNARTKIIINHLCKPNLRLPLSSTAPPDGHDPHSDFTEWKDAITHLARYPYSYMKFSGCWPELPPQSPETTSRDLEQMREQIRPWTDHVFECFGPQRVMFGSDWPVCNLGGLGKGRAWGEWRGFVDALMRERGMAEEAMEWVWWRTANEAYGLEVS